MKIIPIATYIFWKIKYLGTLALHSPNLSLGSFPTWGVVALCPRISEMSVVHLCSNNLSPYRISTDDTRSHCHDDVCLRLQWTFNLKCFQDETPSIWLEACHWGSYSVMPEPPGTATEPTWSWRCGWAASSCCSWCWSHRRGCSVDDGSWTSQKPRTCGKGWSWNVK